MPCPAFLPALHCGAAKTSVLSGWGLLFVVEIEQPLSEEEHRALTWEAATERFMEVADANPPQKGFWREAVGDWAAAQLHNTLTGVEPLRGLAGAGPNTMKAPESLETWRPCLWSGGAMDRRN